jgi:hypothetical protein
MTLCRAEFQPRNFLRHCLFAMSRTKRRKRALERILAIPLRVGASYFVFERHAWSEEVLSNR